LSVGDESGKQRCRHDAPPLLRDVNRPLGSHALAVHFLEQLQFAGEAVVKLFHALGLCERAQESLSAEVVHAQFQHGLRWKGK
jgi:hypothetical protein